jgi:hypothetical protein
MPFDAAYFEADVRLSQIRRCARLRDPADRHTTKLGEAKATNG